MASLKRKRSQRIHNEDTAAAAPAPKAMAPPAHSHAANTTTRSGRSTFDRRATRQSSSVAPAPPTWAADPEPRRRRAKPKHAGDRHGSESNPKLEPVSEDEEDENVTPAATHNPSLRGTRGTTSNQAVPRSVVTPVPTPNVPVIAAAPDKSAATKRGRGRPSTQKHRPVLGSTNQADPALVPKPVIRNTSLRASLHNDVKKRSRHNDDDDDDDDDNNIDRRRRSVTNGLVAPMQTEVAPAPSLTRRGSSVVGPVPSLLPPTSTRTAIHKHHQPPAANIATVPIMTQPHQRTSRISDYVAANTSKPVVPSTSTSTHQLPPQPAKKPRPGKQPEPRRSSVIERNIDKVVFGNVCFSTWYHSPYGTEALGEISGNGVKASNGVNGAQDLGHKDDGLANASSRKTKEEKLDRLYVCPCCFKYSKELVPWWQHVHLCVRRGYVPGEKIYTHPKRRQSQNVSTLGRGSESTAGFKGPGRKRKHSDGVQHTAEQAAADDDGEWSIWQVDGEDEGLFCQNLSLFAKLFLDNKSVFFDVIGFNYFLLVHTTTRQPSSDDIGDPLPPKHQIVGFFSKEKLSWDNNNLACILVFPPWQRKGLGALLMGVSYEISRREGMLGGPEKPISDLGRKGYKRFWAGEIAAWLLELDTNGEEECVIDVDECSKATWIVPEDCLMIFREMGLVEEAEDGPPPKKKKHVELSLVEENGEGGEDGEGAVVNGVEEEVKDVPRVRVSKDAVWAWIQANQISLEKACDPDGFVEGYAIKKPAVEEEEL